MRQNFLVLNDNDKSSDNIMADNFSQIMELCEARFGKKAIVVIETDGSGSAIVYKDIQSFFNSAEGTEGDWIVGQIFQVFNTDSNYDDVVNSLQHFNNLSYYD